MANSENFSSWPRLVISTTDIHLDEKQDSIGCFWCPDCRASSSSGTGCPMNSGKIKNSIWKLPYKNEQMREVFCWLAFAVEGCLLFCHWQKTNDPTAESEFLRIFQTTPRGSRGVVTSFWSPKNAQEWKIFHLDKKRISQKSPEIEKFHQKAIPSWNFSTPAILPKIASTHPDPKNWKCTCGSSPSALLLDQQSSTWWISWQSKPTAALDHYVAW